MIKKSPEEDKEQYRHNSDEENPLDLRKPENVTRLYLQKLASDLSKLRAQYDAACQEVEKNTVLLEIAREGEKAADQAHQTYEVAATAIAEGEQILAQLENPENNFTDDFKKALKAEVDKAVDQVVVEVRKAHKSSRKTAEIYDSTQCSKANEPVDVAKCLSDTKEHSRITAESLNRANEALGRIQRANGELKIKGISATTPVSNAQLENARTQLEHATGISFSELEGFQVAARSRVHTAENALQVSIEKRDSAKIDLNNMEAAVEAMMKEQALKPKNLFQGQTPTLQNIRLAQ